MQKELLSDFISLEKELKLFETRYKGIEVWPLVRDLIYFNIETQRKNYSKRAVKDKNINLYRLAINFILVCINTIKYLVLKKQKADTLFIAHPRRKKHNGKYLDVYTDPVGSRLNVSHQSVEPMYQLSHFRPPTTKKLLYLDAIEYWSRFFSFITKKNLTNEEKIFWLRVKEEIERRFEVNDIEVIKFIELEVARHQLAKPRIKKLIKVIEPSLIIEVVSYHRINKTINIIAKELNIPTAELQHGYIGSKHIAYNFPKGVRVNSFPAYLFLWGDHWRKNIQVPINGSRIISTGFEYFNKKKSQLESRNHKKQILFISQGTIGPELVEHALKLLKLEEYRGYEIVFKLHPAEFSDSRKRYAHLYKTNRVNILDSSSDEDLYQLILDSSLIIGVYSTALIEALGLGKKVFVLKIPGWEALEEFINEDELDIELLEDIDSLKGLSSLKTMKKETDSHFLFAPTDFSITDELVKATRYESIA